MGLGIVTDHTHKQSIYIIVSFAKTGEIKIYVSTQFCKKKGTINNRLQRVKGEHGKGNREESDTL